MKIMLIQVSTRKYNDPTKCLRARAFSNMTAEQQKNFIRRRFVDIDAAELVNIVRAIYGHPDDKGRPRSSRKQALCDLITVPRRSWK
ncbi:MAG TPA: hypothetical protein VG498_10445 [Terriglobales bacterium]|nr:hypothetical protein [Terriglobales bacterium]